MSLLLPFSSCRGLEFAYDVLVAIRSMLTGIFGRLSTADIQLLRDESRTDDVPPEMLALRGYLQELRKVYGQSALANGAWKGPRDPVVCILNADHAWPMVLRTREFMSSLTTQLAAQTEPRTYICTKDCPMRFIARPNGVQHSELEYEELAAARISARPLCQTGAAPCCVCQSVLWVHLRACNVCRLCEDAIARQLVPDPNQCQKPTHGGLFSDVELIKRTYRLNPDSNETDRHVMAEMLSMVRLAKRTAAVAELGHAPRPLKRPRTGPFSAVSETDAQNLLRDGDFGRAVAKAARVAEPSDGSLGDVVNLGRMFGADGPFQSVYDRARVMGTVDLISDPEKKFISVLFEAKQDPSSRMGSQLAEAIVRARDEFEQTITASKEPTAEDWIRTDSALFDAMVADQKAMTDSKREVVAATSRPLSAAVCVAWQMAVDAAHARLSAVDKDPLDDSVEPDEKKAEKELNELGNPRMEDYNQRVATVQQYRRMTAASPELVSFIDATGDDAVKIVPPDPTNRRALLDARNERCDLKSLVSPLGEKRNSSHALVTSKYKTIGDAATIPMLDEKTRPADEARAAGGILATSFTNGRRDREEFAFMAEYGHADRLILTPRAEEILGSEHMGIIRAQLDGCHERRMAQASEELKDDHTNSAMNAIRSIVDDYLYGAEGDGEDADGIIWDRSQPSPASFEVAGCMRGRLYFNYQERYRAERHGNLHDNQMELVCRLAAGFMARVEDVAGRLFNRFLRDRMVDRTPHSPSTATKPLAMLVHDDAEMADVKVAPLADGPDFANSMGICIRDIDELKALRRSFSYSFLAIVTMRVSQRIREDDHGIMNLRRSRILVRETVNFMFGIKTLPSIWAVDEDERDIFSRPYFYDFLFKYMVPAIKFAFFDVMGISLPLREIARWKLDKYSSSAGRLSDLKRASQRTCFELATNPFGIRPLRDPSRRVPAEVNPRSDDEDDQSLIHDIIGLVRWWERASIELMTHSNGRRCPPPPIIAEFKACAKWAAESVAMIAFSEFKGRKSHGPVSRDEARITAIETALINIYDLLIKLCSDGLRNALQSCYHYSTTHKHVCRTCVSRPDEYHVNPFTLIPRLLRTNTVVPLERHGLFGKIRDSRAYTILLSSSLARSGDALVTYAAIRSSLPGDIDAPNGPFRIYPLTSLDEQKKACEAGETLFSPLLLVRDSAQLIDAIVRNCAVPVLNSCPSSSSFSSSSSSVPSVIGPNLFARVFATMKPTRDIRLSNAFALSFIPHTFALWIGWIQKHVPHKDIASIRGAMIASILNRHH